MFVSDESGGVETVINARGRRIATIPLGGEAGNVQYDAGSGRILVDVQTRGDIAVIDPRSNRIVRRVTLPAAPTRTGSSSTRSRRLAFVACDANARLLTLDLRTMRVTGSASVGATPDVLAFDTSLRRLYVAAESGVVAVFAEHRAQPHEARASVSRDRAHTVAVDPRTHLVYFPLQSGSDRRPSTPDHAAFLGVVRSFGTEPMSEGRADVAGKRQAASLPEPLDLVGHQEQPASGRA